MLLWLFVILLFVGIILCVLNHSQGWYSDTIQIFGILTWAISAFVLIIMVIVLIDRYTQSEGLRASNEEIYKALIYKSQSELCRDEFGILNKDYIDEIQEWNSDVMGYKMNARNPWIGIFYPDWINDLETIDLESIKLKSN